jgi:hypothetical protein
LFQSTPLASIDWSGMVRVVLHDRQKPGSRPWPVAEPSSPMHGAGTIQLQREAVAKLVQRRQTRPPMAPWTMYVSGSASA